MEKQTNVFIVAFVNYVVNDDSIRELSSYFSVFQRYMNVMLTRLFLRYSIASILYELEFAFVCDLCRFLGILS
jgi:uncharacterized protein YybS (DUF2232 family)